jgi:hypothetical protein
MADAGQPGPVSAVQALLVVTGVWTLLLGLLATRLPGSYLKRALVLFVVVFGVNCVLSTVEAMLFLVGRRLVMGNVAAMAVNGFVAAALLSLAAAGALPQGS